MKNEFLALKEQTVHYLVGGKGNYLIILPSLWLTSKSFENIGEKLSAHFKVIIPDLYKGKSQLQKAAKKIEDYSFLLNEFISKLNIDKCFVIGVSFSGFIATIFTNSYPAKINKLLLVSTSATSLDVNNKFFKFISGYVKLICNNYHSHSGRVINSLWFYDAFAYFFRHPLQFIFEAAIALKNYEKPTVAMKRPSKLILTKKDEFIPSEAIEINTKVKNLEVEVIDKPHSWIFIEQEKMIEILKNYFS